MDKTKLLWAGTRHALLQESVCFPSLQLAANTIHPSHNVRVLGVEFSADLSLKKHTHHKGQRDLLLPFSSTPTCPAYTQYGVCYDTGARVFVMSRLLQRRFRRGSKGYH